MLITRVDCSKESRGIPHSNYSGIDCIGCLENMSGEPPNGFELHCSDNGVDGVTARQLADQIRDWLGVEGISDMRAYVRFRALDYFKNQLLPGDVKRTSKPVISEEEMAINSLVIDFAHQHKYYFTLCLLISEMQAFSEFDERMKPVLTQISTMTTDDMENVSPLLGKELLYWIFGVLNIDPQSENAINILKAYHQEKRQCLIQLILSHKNCSNYTDPYLKRAEVGNYQKNASTNDGDFNEIFEKFTNEITKVNRKIKHIESKVSRSSLGMKEKRRSKASEEEIKRLKWKIMDVVKNVENVRDSVQVLMDLVEHLRSLGDRALQSCTPYIRHNILATTTRISRLEVAMRRAERKLTAQRNQSKVRAIKRRCLRSRKLASENNTFTRKYKTRVVDKAVQTEKFMENDELIYDQHRGTKPAVAIQTSPVILVDARVGSDFQHQSTNVESLPQLVTGTGIESQETNNKNSLKHSKLSKSHEASDDELTKEEEKQCNGMKTAVGPFRGQDTAMIMEQNYELQEKVLEQGRRINYLTARIAQIHDDLTGKKEKEEQKSLKSPGKSRTDASTNTDEFEIVRAASVICRKHDIELKHRRELLRFNSTPLEKALRTAKAEMSILKRERRHIEDCYVSRSNWTDETNDVM
ncbi:hypothetical protein GE061_001218 [Apolygus lucorum]|uniref:Uncharacterized protein n=1 Tax=Apolygus lucorum TaxID=248454 RepID=A0A8S9Y941_APOLU|nr:hypothetical protein GE061_001218 [Apolygus lucorum]